MNSKKIAEISRSNFVPTFWCLPEPKQNALNTIYAYCRLTDDMVDHAGISSGVQESQSILNQWRKETEQSLESKSDHPILQELAEVVRQYQIPREYFQQLIDGVQMDLEKNSYNNFEELHQYCYRVAGVVGLMCLNIFGFNHPRTKDYAINLGIAFQLTNILRDIKTDAQRGRVYIPEDTLRNYSLTREDLLSFADSNSPILKQSKTWKISQAEEMIRYECKRAEDFYQKAKENLVSEDRPNLIAAEMMCAVYHSILNKIRSNALCVFESKVGLSMFEKAVRMAQGWFANRFKL